MKTNVHILSGLLLTGVLLLSLLYFSPARAGKAVSATPDTSMESQAAGSYATLISEPEKSIAVISNTMLDDPYFWVNYLKSTIDPQEQNESESTGVLDEMESDPQYWVNSLKHIVAAE